MNPGFIIWNPRPQLIDFGSFEIRYYSLLFALGFVTGYMILTRIFKKLGKKQELLDILTVYMVLSTIVGARLGHCLFYEWSYYSQHPLEIILPFRGKIGNNFEFTGFQGLASHGAGIGIIIGILLFARKTKSSFLWTMDMIVLVTALAGCFIRLGNLMNSEIYGKPVKEKGGFVFTHDLSRLLTRKYEGTIDHVKFEKIAGNNVAGAQGVPLKMDVYFAKKIKDARTIEEFGHVFLPADLKRYDFDNNILPPASDSLPVNVQQKDRHLVLSTVVMGVPRYPTQIYEAASYLFIFLVLLLIYYKLDTRLREGFLFGVFLVLVFLARFLIEFVKENQESFEDKLSLNMGQILSIPFVLAGLLLVYLKWPRHESSPS
jgi:phosphatidylglycerol---prolipoprotein diacylglyceryl transferase